VQQSLFMLVGGPFGLWRANVRSVQCLVVRTLQGTRTLERAYHAFALVGVCVVPFSGIVEPEQLTILAVAVEQHCRQASIDPASPEGQAVAQVVLRLFNGGAATIDDLKAAMLVSSRREEAGRYG
jgi:hypothetical protein